MNQLIPIPQAISVPLRVRLRNQISRCHDTQGNSEAGSPRTPTASNRQILKRQLPLISAGPTKLPRFELNLSTHVTQDKQIDPRPPALPPTSQRLTQQIKRKKWKPQVSTLLPSAQHRQESPHGRCGKQWLRPLASCDMNTDVEASVPIAAAIACEDTRSSPDGASALLSTSTVDNGPNVCQGHRGDRANTAASQTGDRRVLTQLRLSTSAGRTSQSEVSGICQGQVQQRGCASAAIKAALVDGQEDDPRVNTWTPPASPWSLLEEALYDNPWRLLVACILLNRTTGRQVHPMSR